MKHEPANNNLGALTALRGLAAVMVVLFHFEQGNGFIYLGETHQWGLRQFIANGYLSVDLFFVLSGYVLATKYSHVRLDQFNLIFYLHFLKRRFARTYPVYLGTTLLVIGIWLLEGYHDIRHWPTEMFTHPIPTVLANLGMVQAWGLAPSLNSPAWSVSAEWLMYIAFPAIIAGVFNRRLLIRLGALLVIPCVLGFLVYSGNEIDKAGPLDYHDYFELRTLLRCFLGFMLGVVVSDAEGCLAFKSVISQPWALLGLSGLVVSLLCLRGSDYADVLAFPFLVAAFGNAEGRLLEALNLRAFRAMGALSYSLYLLHDQIHPAQRFIEAFLSPAPDLRLHLLSLVTIAGLLYITSYILYVLVECPMRTFLTTPRTRPKLDAKKAPCAAAAHLMT